MTLLDGNQVLVNKYDESEKLGLFQLQLRYDEGHLVMNSIGPGAHGDEIKDSISIDKEEKVKIKIKVTKNKYKVNLI